MITACPFCHPVAEALLWQDHLCRVVWVDDPHYLGYCRVITHAHVREMTDLPADERCRLMAVVFAVEAALRELMQPTKINLASLGNQVPHLHWHVIARFEDDPHYPDPIWAAPRRPGHPQGNGGALKQRLGQAIAAILSPPE